MVSSQPTRVFSICHVKVLLLVGATDGVSADPAGSCSLPDATCTPTVLPLPGSPPTDHWADAPGKLNQGPPLPFQ